MDSWLQCYSHIWKVHLCWKQVQTQQYYSRGAGSKPHSKNKLSVHCHPLSYISNFPQLENTVMGQLLSTPLKTQSIGDECCFTYFCITTVDVKGPYKAVKLNTYSSLYWSESTYLIEDRKEKNPYVLNWFSLLNGTIQFLTVLHFSGPILNSQHFQPQKEEIPVWLSEEPLPITIDWTDLTGKASYWHLSWKVATSYGPKLGRGSLSHPIPILYFICMERVAGVTRLRPGILCS